MKIIRSGHHKPTWTKILADQDICSHDRKSQMAPQWDKERLTLCFRSRGHNGRTATYDYSIEISLGELALLLDVAICESTDDATARALGKAISCFLKEFLSSSRRTGDENR